MKSEWEVHEKLMKNGLLRMYPGVAKRAEAAATAISQLATN